MGLHHLWDRCRDLRSSSSMLLRSDTNIWTINRVASLQSTTKSNKGCSSCPKGTKKRRALTICKFRNWRRYRRRCCRVIRKVEAIWGLKIIALKEWSAANLMLRNCHLRLKTSTFTRDTRSKMVLARPTTSDLCQNYESRPFWALSPATTPIRAQNSVLQLPRIPKRNRRLSTMGCQVFMKTTLENTCKRNNNSVRNLTLIRKVWITCRN